MSARHQLCLVLEALCELPIHHGACVLIGLNTSVPYVTSRHLSGLSSSISRLQLAEPYPKHPLRPDLWLE